MVEDNALEIFPKHYKKCNFLKDIVEHEKYIGYPADPPEILWDPIAI